MYPGRVWTGVLVVPTGGGALVGNLVRRASAPGSPITTIITP
jgi:hypothetical protein